MWASLWTHTKDTSMNEHMTSETTTTEFTELETIGAFAGWVKLPSGGFLNLSLVALIQPEPDDSVVSYVERGWVGNFVGDDARALLTYLDEQAVDLKEGSDADN